MFSAYNSYNIGLYRFEISALPSTNIKIFIKQSQKRIPKTKIETEKMIIIKIMYSL